MKDKNGKEVTHEMLVELAKFMGVTVECVEDWIEDGFIYFSLEPEVRS